ncbi:MAG: ATP-binding protein [Micavibrio sp.]
MLLRLAGLETMQNKQKRQRYGMYGFGRVFALLMLLSFCLLLKTDSLAQSGTYAAQLNLNNDSQRYNLAPYVYVTKDPGGALTYKGVISRHLSGQRGDVMRGKILTLGSSSTPHWVIASISNQSAEENWVLDFGEHLDGRMGLIDKIFIYNHTVGKRIIDTVSPSQVPGVATDQFKATAVPLQIASGHAATLVMYVVPRAGVPLTLGFDLLSESEFLKEQSSPFKKSSLVFMALALIVGFHAACMFLMRSWGNISFVGYYLAIILLFSLDNNITGSELTNAQDFTAWVFWFSFVLACFAVKSFFGIGRYDGTPFRVLLGLPLITGLLVVLVTIFLPDASVMRHIVLGGIFVLGHLFLAIVSLAQMFQGRKGAPYMFMGWGCLFLGSCISMLSCNGILVAVPMTVSAYWYALFVQAALVSIAVMMDFIYQDMQQDFDEEAMREEKQHVNRISQVRENQEFHRLKRLVEHERQVMQELRDREVQQNEEMRQARHLADEANRAKSAFLAVVSHEIRTPMTGIMGMVRLLLDTALSPSQKDYAQTIQDSGDAMMALLNDILDFEKIESGKMDLEMIDFDLHRLANSVVTLMSGHANNKDIYLKLDMDPSVPHYLVGDPVRMRQVLLNLVGNSIKFTKQGGVTLEIKAEPNSEGLARGNMSKIRFSVKDTGVGISKEAQNNLFKPFAQADSSVSRKFGGTGLGLAISQRLIEAMGGRIQIESEEGRGSSFFFVLILEEGSSSGVSDQESGREGLSAKSSKALKILVVEDNQINQKLLKEFIGRMGHEVITADSGEDGIEAVREHNPDMVFMDVELPGISGMGATKAIRAMAEDDLAGTPVIALTGNTREDDIRTCYAANMNGHLAKPVDPMRLRQMIDKVISGKLDNPVELSESRETSYTQTTQLSSAGKATVVKPASAREAENKMEVKEPPLQVTLPEKIEVRTENQDLEKSAAPESVIHLPPPAPEPTPAPVSPPPAPAKPATDQSAVLRHIMQGGDDDFEFEEPAPKKSVSAEPEKSLISTLVAEQEESYLALDDDEIDEDSFALALDAADSKDGHAGDRMFDAVVFDSSTLDPLKSAMKQEDLKEMIDGLLDKAEEIVLALDVALNAGDTSTITARAHELKGMAGNFGLMELSKIAEKIEKDTKGDKDADVSDLISEIPQAYKRARADISAWMG